MKQELGKQIETLRKECGVSTYQLEKRGIHPSLPSTIEKGQKGYSIDSLIKYLKAIDEDIFLSVEKKEKPQRRLPKTRKCDWCDKRKPVTHGYYLGKFENEDWFICRECNFKHDVV